jgi:cytochrome c oxidase assembly protein subunit 15
MTAYALWMLALLHAVDVLRNARRDPVVRHAFVLAALVTLQAVLGIATLVHQVPIGLALMHQAGALLVLTLAVVHLQRLTPRRHRVADANRLNAAGAKT